MARVILSVQLAERPNDQWLTDRVAPHSSKSPETVDVVTLGSRVALVSASNKEVSPEALVKGVWEKALLESAAEANVSLDECVNKELPNELMVFLTERFGLTVQDVFSSVAVGCNKSTMSRHGSEFPIVTYCSISVRLLEVVEGNGRFLLPGWIDMQVNDLEWMARWESEDGISISQHVERIEELLTHQVQHGVTGLCIATVAAPLENLVLYLQAMREVMTQQLEDGGREEKKQVSSHLHGAVVEGTFMNPENHGCHNPKYVLPPSWPVLNQLLQTGAVKTVNIAPEMGDEEVTLELIRKASSMTTGYNDSVLVAAGHCKPHAVMMRKAIAAGCSYVIHLGNGPTGSSFKAECDGGMMEECLRNDDITATVICDECHVHPALIRDWTSRKCVDRMLAVSDAAFGLGVPTAGVFEVFGRKGKLSSDRKCLVQADKVSTPGHCRTSDKISSLFGSNATMHDMFENLLNLFSSPLVGVYYRHHPALPLHQAVSIASALCARNPACLLGKASSHGLIAPGFIADMLLVTVRDSSTCEVNLSHEDLHPASRYTVAIDQVWCCGNAMMSLRTEG